MKQAKASLKEAVETVNTLKAEIDALGLAVDEAKAKAAAERGADEPAEVVDAETYASMVALKKTKARYRATFEEVKGLKASLPDLTTAAAETRAALVQAFQEWYEKGGGLDLLVQRDADEDDSCRRRRPAGAAESFEPRPRVGGVFRREEGASGLDQARPGDAHRAAHARARQHAEIGRSRRAPTLDARPL